MRSVARAAILLLVALAAAACERAEPPVPDALRTAPAEWDRLFNAGDAAALAALYAENASSMPYDAPTLQGRQALETEFARFFSENTGRHETLVDELIANDDWAIERARYVLTYAPRSGGPEARETGRHVMCRKKKDGTWQIAWELWNKDAPG
jgi:uncharacterized protein (TIGR02246 family)